VDTIPIAPLAFASGCVSSAAGRLTQVKVGNSVFLSIRGDPALHGPTHVLLIK